MPSKISCKQAVGFTDSEYRCAGCLRICGSFGRNLALFKHSHSSGLGCQLTFILYHMVKEAYIGSQFNIGTSLWCRRRSVQIMIGQSISTNHCLKLHTRRVYVRIDQEE